MIDPSEPDAVPGFLSEVAGRSRALDWLLLSAAPAVLVAVHALPLPIREALAFARADPSLATAFTAHYVHLSTAHLLGNLAVYLLIAPTAYLLLLLSGRRSEFLAVTATVLLVFPFVLTGLDTIVIPQGTLVGFSGLTMAFIGVLPVAAFLFLDDRIEPAVGLDDAPSLFFAGLALISFRAVRSPTGLALTAVAALIALAYLIRIGRTLPRQPGRQLGGLLPRSGYVELAVASPVLFALAILAAFPTDPVRSGTVVNLYGHLLGYTLGFIATFLTVRLVRATGGEVQPLPATRVPPPDADGNDREAEPPDGAKTDLNR